MNVGYHYTSYDNWLKIQEKGLAPRLVRNLEVYNGMESIGDYRRQVFGVWVWETRHTGQTHLGGVLRVLAVHKATRVVFLKVYYEETDKIKIKGKDLTIIHDGVIGDFDYHNKEKSVLLKHIIPPKQIELVSEYNLLDLVQ